MDYSELAGFKQVTKNIKIPRTGFEWQKGVWQLIFKPYKHYIITGTPGSLSNWVLAILAIPLKKKVYAWTHGMKGNTSPAGKFIEKNFYRLCHRILLYGEYSKNNMVKEGFNAKKLIPIYNSLDYEKQLRVRKTLEPSAIFRDYFNNEYPVLIYIGRIQKSKKIDLLVKAQKQLLEQGIFCNLILIGEDSDGNNIPQLVQELGLNSYVWFYGPCYDENEIGNLIFNSDVCITPGSIGLTTIHSLTYGTPVITNNNISSHGPEFEAIESGVTGDFFLLDNIEDLCQKIRAWISVDTKNRNILRMQAYKKVDEIYNPNYQINVLKKILNHS
ncbi:glycosyltransferase [Arenibacter sp. BSSL-BM3]|uniref:Glycosyltransferase n=1 Tax=Arenibacter arenosicollis TaxID=2762274 RepID=A0ABR7QL58_9FLAO|nr:glycosyltransferase [Arenibacter arenosicollis]MBC8767874.1 glycosyltransferase [Arenibacter arenosicollis]